MIVTLEELKYAPVGSYDLDLEDKVYIHSAEHKAYWGPNGSGYYGDKKDAGLYLLKDALARTISCDPSKKITFELYEAPTQVLVDVEVVREIRSFIEGVAEYAAATGSGGKAAAKHLLAKLPSEGE